MSYVGESEKKIIKRIVYLGNDENLKKILFVFFCIMLKVNKYLIILARLKGVGWLESELVDV